MSASSSGSMSYWTHQRVERHRRTPKARIQRDHSQRSLPLQAPNRPRTCDASFIILVSWIFLTLTFAFFLYTPRRLLSTHGPTIILFGINNSATSKPGLTKLALVLNILVPVVAATRMRNSRVSSHENSRPAVTNTLADAAVRKINVFVRGLTHKEVHLVMQSNQSVGDTLSRLRRRHLLPSLTRVKYSVFSSTSLTKPLREHDILHNIGISDLSTLHIRAHILGGVRDTPDSLSRATAFTEDTGMFASENALHFKPDGDGKFICLPCSNYKNPPHLHHRYIEEHQQSKAHQRAVARFGPEHVWEVEGDVQASSSSSTPQTRIAGSERRPDLAIVQNGLVGLLDWVARSGSNGAASFVSPSCPPSPPINEDSDFQMDWDAVGMEGFHLQSSYAEAAMATMAARLSAYLQEDGAISADSDDEPCEREDSGSEMQEHGDETTAGECGHRREVHVNMDKGEWYPWPDKMTCVLDILRHIPRCAFSDRQNSAIHWAMVAAGVTELPSERSMKNVDRALQQLCGIQTLRYYGALGNIYYMNDFAAIVAQEMANPRVRPHLQFIPEDAGGRLEEAWQARRWLHELDMDLTTQNFQHGGYNFYLLEPCMLRDGRVCMPTRWFLRGSRTMAKAWSMSQFDTGWVVNEHDEFTISSSDLAMPFDHLVAESQADTQLTDPRHILGSQRVANGPFLSWDRTNPRDGNRWRKKAGKHRVVAFPVWLYCDDTSGNLSKRWNKHNSFLFTAAGLPRRHVHQEYNVHFLSTSNLAPPLEMLDGFVEQLSACQREGIWAWDYVLQEPVLVIPSVLAMLGDNPMQSEMACHVGLMGKLFCRVCRVVGDGKAPEGELHGREDCPIPEVAENGDMETHSVASGSDGGNTVGSEGSELDDSGLPSSARKAPETKDEMRRRVTQFMQIGRARTRLQTVRELRSQFAAGKIVGGMSGVKRMRTASGIKDTFQNIFLERLFSITKGKGTSKARKQEEVDRFVAKELLGHYMDYMSPVWRIRDLDPHSDTPVEILHVILLGFVKYLWRDAIARISPNVRPTLTARLSSFDVAGFGVSPIAGATLVNYSGSLMGRDFRIIAQAAPVVLQGLPGIPEELLGVWAALARLVALVWEPQIADAKEYYDDLKSTIDYFLEMTCRCTPRWFNKPKFHILLHLPDHVIRFGPAMLFATEGFESFNAIIRAHSVHSNHQAPSRDIALSIARCNRTRHLLSGGQFPDPLVVSQLLQQASEEPAPNSSPGNPPASPWLSRSQSLPSLDRRDWISASAGGLSLIHLSGFSVRLLGFPPEDMSDPHEMLPGLCRHVGAPRMWSSTSSSQVLASDKEPILPPTRHVRTPQEVLISENTWCCEKNWVTWLEHGQAVTGGSGPVATVARLGRVIEIIQIAGSPNELQGHADFVMVERANVGTVHEAYRFRRAILLREYQVLRVQDIQSLVNVQHNCIDYNCPLLRTRVVRQEREQTEARMLEVSHKPTEDFIINTGQMRNSRYLKAFRGPIPRHDRDALIEAAVTTEVEVNKARTRASGNRQRGRGHGRARVHGRGGGQMNGRGASGGQSQQQSPVHLPVTAPLMAGLPRETSSLRQTLAHRQMGTWMQDPLNRPALADVNANPTVGGAAEMPAPTPVTPSNRFYSFVHGPFGFPNNNTHPS